MNKTILVIILASLAILAAGVWFFSTQETREEEQKVETAPNAKSISDLGRTHVAEGTKITYNSNPPTSGPHYATWVKYGVYDKPQVDELLVHSLEHGYVIISYNCSPQGGEGEASGSAALDTASCEKLKNDLVTLAEKERLWKLIVIPRPTLDTPIALTAWTRLDKMDKFDATRITAFIDAFRDKGPEKTME